MPKTMKEILENVVDDLVKYDKYVDYWINDILDNSLDTENHRMFKKNMDEIDILYRKNKAKNKKEFDDIVKLHSKNKIQSHTALLDLADKMAK